VLDGVAVEALVWIFVTVGEGEGGEAVGVIAGMLTQASKMARINGTRM